jgi:hypothetical protein
VQPQVAHNFYSLAWGGAITLNPTSTNRAQTPPKIEILGGGFGHDSRQDYDWGHSLEFLVHPEYMDFYVRFH